MVADDTPAVQAVLKADTRRLKLLEEEKRLQALLEKGEDSASERLEKVRGFLFCFHSFPWGCFLECAAQNLEVVFFIIEC